MLVKADHKFISQFVYLMGIEMRDNARYTCLHWVYLFNFIHFWLNKYKAWYLYCSFD